MSDKHILGIYWGQYQLYCTLTGDDQKPLKTFTVNLAGEAESPEYGGLKLKDQSFDLGQRLQSALKANDVDVTSVHLSLSTKDTIFRTFVIPWVQSSEVKALVEFEASKYLPFTLDELAFAYHAATFTENNQKRLRILFVAIKKAAIEDHIDKLEQTGLKVDVIEPSPSSLMRTLVSKQLLNLGGTVAVINSFKTSGRISIVNQALPYFVREFQLMHKTEDGHDDAAVSLTRLVNEIRISCDYFNRQSTQLAVNEAVLMAGDDLEELSKVLKDELSFPVIPIKHEQLMPDDESGDIGFICAYGISLVDKVALPANLFLSQRKAKTTKTTSSTGGQGLNMKFVVLTAVVCSALIGGTFMLVNKATIPLRKKISRLESDLGNYAKQKASAIKKDFDAKRDRLKDLEKIRFKSEFSGYLSAIPELLPEGAWLKNLEIYYPEQKENKSAVKAVKKKITSKKTGSDKNEAGKKTPPDDLPKNPEIVIEGYVYLDNSNEQFGVVNRFLGQIKEQELFKDKYKKVALDAVKTEKMNNFPVTYFKIICQEK